MSKAYDASLPTVEPTLQIPRLKFGGLGEANARALANEVREATVNLPRLRAECLARNPQWGMTA